MEPNDFFVKSMRHCFLCLNQITSVQEAPPRHVDFEHGLQELQSFSIYPLHTLTRYLKMDMGKVFSENELIPHQLLDKVRKSKLKGELCDDCALLNDTFSEQYLKLVKIKMEMTSSLRLIQDKLLAAVETNKSKNLRKLASSVTDPVDGWTGKLDILEVLRAEAIQKCSEKIQADTPRPKVKNLTTEQVHNARLKFKVNRIPQVGGSNFEGAPYRAMISGNVKTNRKTESPTEIGVDADNSFYSDTSEMHTSDADNDFVVDESGNDVSYPTGEDRTTGSLIQSRFEKVDGNTRKTNNGNGIDSSSLLSSASDFTKLKAPEVSLDRKTGKYMCSLCPIQFKTKTYAKTHFKSVHLGIKYKCSICAKEFTQNSAFNLHHRTIHMGVGFKCLGCNKIFKQKGNLTAHQRKHGCQIAVTKTEMD